MNRSNFSRFARVLAVALIAFTAPAAAKGGKGQDYENLENGPYYMRLERIVVPRIHANVVEAIVTYVLVAEFKDPEARDRAKLVMPKLMDAYVRDLYVLTSRAGTSGDGVDLAVAKTYLMASAARVLGAEAVKDVLIERIVSRKAG
jgi:hypothetical protein